MSPRELFGTLEFVSARQKRAHLTAFAIVRTGFGGSKEQAQELIDDWTE